MIKGMHPRYEHHVGRIFLYILTGISILIMIPATLIIIHEYYKHHSKLTAKTAMFKTGFCYFIFTLLFYINFCLRLLNECLGDGSYGYIFVCSTALLYGTHFALLIYLLFCRIYYVFSNTQYKLSKYTLFCFITLCIFLLLDVVLFIFVVLYTNGDSHVLIFILYTIGVITIILMTIWITILYTYNLFRLIRANTSTTPQNSKLLANVSKYTLLAIIWISTGIIFWCAPFMALYGMDYLTYLVLYHTFILLDVCCNKIAFVLGYRFADKVYLKLCGGIDKMFQNFIKYLVECTKKRTKTKNELNLANHIKDQKEPERQTTVETDIDPDQSSVVDI